MKIVTVIARILLGLIFLVSGLNGFFNFLHGSLPSGMAGEFLGVLIRSHYIWLIAGTQVVSGALLLIDRFVPLALVLGGALIANILTFHATMNPTGAQLAIVATILWLFLAYRLRAVLAPLFVQKTTWATDRRMVI